MSFGELFKEYRIRTGLSLRAFCLENRYDPGNISRLERGRVGPPESQDILNDYARALRLKKGSTDWQTFMDQASAEKGRIPHDLMSDEELVEKLPVLYRTLRNHDTEKLLEFAEKIRRL